jgi:hypothetical protein
MSPEQLSGSAESIGPRCDIYSLGVIMYELLTACRPFVGQEAVILGQILFIEPAPPSGHRPDLDTQIEAICLKAMAKRPEDRYAAMGELAAALGKYLRGAATATPIQVQIDEERDSTAFGSANLADPAPDLCQQPADVGFPAAPESEQLLPLVTSEPPGEAEPASLERLWRHWTGIVELFALRRSRRHVDWQAYHGLHQSLIEACRTRASAADGALRAFYRHLEDLALPWLTPKTLAQVDQEILFSLLLCCRRAEQELCRDSPEDPQNGNSARFTTLVWGASVFLALSIVAWLVSLIWSAV